MTSYSQSFGNVEAADNGAPILTTLPDFIVNVDRAQHVVITHIDADGHELRTIDFGITSQVADVVNAWMDLGEPAALNVLAPAMNAYLLEQFED